MSPGLEKDRGISFDWIDTTERGVGADFLIACYVAFDASVASLPQL